jgi:hypothetical protein
MSPKLGWAPAVQQVCNSVSNAASRLLKAVEGSGVAADFANGKTVGNLIAAPLKSQWPLDCRCSFLPSDISLKI